MNLRESTRFAGQGVTANKMRSALTTLGILIGVAAVIILVAVGTGSSKAVADSISALGSNTLTVSSTSTTGGGRGGYAAAGRRSSRAWWRSQHRDDQQWHQDPSQRVDDGRRRSADQEDAMRQTFSASRRWCRRQSVTATYAGASHSVNTFTGSTPTYLLINNDTVATGSAFTDADYTAHRRVALVGTTVAKDLAGGNGKSIMGKTVAFNGKQFTVVGILTAKGSTGPQDQDDRVVAPATAVQDTLAGYGSLSSISVKATSSSTTVGRAGRGRRPSWMGATTDRG